jgi:hypothetical protein
MYDIEPYLNGIFITVGARRPQKHNGYAHAQQPNVTGTRIHRYRLGGETAMTHAPPGYCSLLVGASDVDPAVVGVEPIFDT